ncbi:MAG: hypothetical protein M0P23_06125 [Bacteroidales bacterium]|jgi:hypothetical protein|nr:hypothetical protein [Bacteroidales bacterium]NLB02607.1 hypothetical protein [Bacteroidales bacterium]
MKIKIQNMDIWECKDAIYCKRSDGNLIKIQSNANHKIIEVLKHLRTTASLENFQSEYISKTEFSEIVKFLLSNNLIYRENERKKQTKKIGFYGNNDVFAHLNADLKTEQFELSFDPVYENKTVQGLHLILAISPVFDHYSLLQELSYRSYKSMIPILYVEFSPSTLTLGPLVVPAMNTPSLSCYMKRKAVNLSSLALYSEFILSEEKQRCHNVDIRSFAHYSSGMQLIMNELERFWTFKGKLSSHLMGKSYTIDFLQYKTEETQILKDPASPLFKSSVYSPFNA